MAPSPSLLSPNDPDPVGVLNAESLSPFLLICDHAGNAVPRRLGDLGIADEERGRHIGIDIGALPVATRLSALLEAPLYFQRYSRLVIDVNRQVHAPDSIPAVSDGTAVPTNEGLGEGDRRARAEAILEPYHAAIEAAIRQRLEAERETILVSVHSFTPRLRARPADRPWHVGVMWAENGRFARRVLEAMTEEPGLMVGANEPYAVDMANDYSIPIHAVRRGVDHVEFEIRQDLLGGDAEAETWAARLARVLRTAQARHCKDAA